MMIYKFIQPFFNFSEYDLVFCSNFAMEIERLYI